MKNPDVLVIGGGCMGVCAARALRAAGFRRIAVLDKNAIGTGITAESGGMIRTFHKEADDRELAAQGSRFYRSLTEHIGSTGVFTKTGALSFLSSDLVQSVPQVTPHLRELSARFDTRFEMITADEGAERFPDLHWKKTDFAIYEPDAGYVQPRSFMLAMTDALRRQGIDVYEKSSVLELRPLSGTVRITATSHRFEAGHVVLAAGIGTPALLRSLGVDLSWQLRSIQIHRPRIPQKPLPLPNVFDYDSGLFFSQRDEHLIVGLPSCASKMNWSRFAPLEAPAIDDHLMNQTHKALLRRTRLTPDWASASSSTTVAYDLYEPQRHGRIGVLPGFERVSIIAGFGGGGFKFAPALGERLAQHLYSSNQRSFLEDIRDAH